MHWAHPGLCSLARIAQGGVLPSGEAVCCVPSTLVALCLNVKGLKRVEESRALECLVPIFTTPNYLRALQVRLHPSNTPTFPLSTWLSGGSMGADRTSPAYRQESADGA